MNLSRLASLTLIFQSLLVLLLVGLASDASANPAADALIAKMEKLSQPTGTFQSREQAVAFVLKASDSISQLADQLLAGEPPYANLSEDQLVAATQWKHRALAMRAKVGDADAAKQVKKFFLETRKHQSPTVATTALWLQIGGLLEEWAQVPVATRSRLLDELAKEIEGAELTETHVRMMTQVADALGDGQERKKILAIVKPMLPRLESLSPIAADAAAKQLCEERLAGLQGVARRLQLPGGPIEVEGQTLAGKPIAWEKYRGKVVLIDFWATWCGLCVAEQPHVMELYQQYREKGFEVVGVSLDDDKAAVERFVQQNSIEWPTVLGPTEQASGWNHPMVVRYGIHALPQAILVDQEGKVVHLNARGKALEQKLAEMLGAPVVANTRSKAIGSQVAAIAD